MLISVVSLTQQIKTNTMTSSERLLNGQKSIKPAYLITSKEELIKERDAMEANWNNSMSERMKQISMQSVRLFNITISNL
jgi:hypothetical protein